MLLELQICPHCVQLESMPADPESLQLASEQLQWCPELCQLLKEREDAWLQAASALIQRKQADEEQLHHLGNLSMSLIFTLSPTHQHALVPATIDLLS